MREYFISTPRLGFSKWTTDDGALATLLWGDAEVSRLICASGVFTADEISARLELEIANGEAHGMQYWPVFWLESGELVGCCGFRPWGDDLELGYHLRPAYWGRGIATEAAGAAIGYAGEAFKGRAIHAGHNPKNAASAAVLAKLGFEYTGDSFYAPTGLMHPTYVLRQD